jgi:hypothetical protein
LLQDLLLLEEQEGSVNFKFGVLYTRPGQTSDDEMLSNGEYSYHLYMIQTGSVQDLVCLFCLFVVYLTTLFQYLRLYSVDLYSILIRLPYSSEAGEMRVRNMAAEFCRRAPIMLVGFFYMP